MTKYIIFIILMFLSLVIVGCEKKFIEIDKASLSDRLDESKYNSAVSWWYIGESNGYYYLVEKWPLNNNYYKINKKNILIKTEKTIEYPAEVPINLKLSNFVLD